MGLNSSSGAYAGLAKTVLLYESTKRSGTKCAPVGQIQGMSGGDKIPYHHGRNGAQHQDLSSSKSRRKANI